MKKEDIFWAAIEGFSADPKSKKTPIQRAWLDTIYDTLVELNGGVWEAGNFVKLCTHLKSCTLDDISRALLDLKSHHFNYEDTIAGEMRRTSVQPQRSRGYAHSFYHDFSYAGNKTENVARYPAQRISAGTPDMESFLSDHFSDLTQTQRRVLHDLRPGKVEEPELRIV